MYISGAGITTPIRVEIKPGFTTEYVPSLKWAMCSSGKWVASDRGTSADIYKCEVEVRGYEHDVNDLLTGIHSNRIASTGSSNQLTLTAFESTEKIFGESVNHATVNATVIDIGERQQTSLNSFTVSLKLQAISPTLLGDGAESLTFKYLDFEYTGDDEKTIVKVDSYAGQFTYVDARADRGVMKFNAYLSLESMRLFYRTLETKRANPITTTVQGINSPYGPVRSTGTWPRNLKYLEVKDLGLWGLNYHRVQVKAVEDI
jgi:hypothetical protein